MQSKKTKLKLCDQEFQNRIGSYLVIQYEVLGAMMMLG
jgi:hypothetical protein